MLRVFRPFVSPFLALAVLAPLSSAGEDEFNYLVPSGETVFFDTVLQAIVNDDGTQQKVAVDGLLEVHDFTIRAGGRIRVTGPNPFLVCASGEVVIEGEIDVSGFPAIDVQSLMLAGVPQAGGPGLGQGGTGGKASPLTTESSPMGEPGWGPFGVAGDGGQGGESGYTASDEQLAHHSGGGGGGRFAADVRTPGQTLGGDGLGAQAGFDGWDTNIAGVVDAPGALGALSGEIPAVGGAAGLGPFEDATPLNDFFGLRILPSGRVIRGELPGLWAGYGGGGGGDSISLGVFPTPNFMPSNSTFDRKGGAGGGGAGAIQIRALGDVRFGAVGRILCDGGEGGESQNFPFNQNRPGGGGGGGSGGHVVIETRSMLNLSDVTGEFISARGGRGGESTIGELGVGSLGFMQLGRLAADGGAGGPGVIQVHLPGRSLAEQYSHVILPEGVPVESFTAPDAIIALPLDGPACD